MSTPANTANSANSANTANTVCVTRPVHSIQDLGTGIIDAVYDSRETEENNPAENTPARPVPRNLDALADLLRETRAERVVVMDWRVPQDLADRLFHVFTCEGVALTHM